MGYHIVYDFENKFAQEDYMHGLDARKARHATISHYLIKIGADKLYHG